MHRSKNQFSREECIADLQDYVAAHDGIVPKKDEFITNSLTGYAYSKFFNRSYNEFVQAAGFAVNTFRKRITQLSQEEIEAIRNKDYGEEGEKIIQEFFFVKELLDDKIPSADEFKVYSDSKTRFRSVFGCYGNLVRAAGFDYVVTRSPAHNKKAAPKSVKEEKEEETEMKESNKKQATNRLPDEELIQEIGQLAIEHPEIIHASKLLEFGSHGISTYYAHFGGKEKIMEIATAARRRHSLVNPPVNKIWAKRYPIRYNASSVLLKWYRRRTDVSHG